MFERVLVPLDGSRESERAVPVAARIARASGGSLVFVSVALPPVEFGTYTAERTVALKPGAFKKRMAEAASYLSRITETYASDLVGIDMDIDVADGAASPMVYAAAQFEGVDLTVLCSHHEGGLKRWIFGSVAHEALRHSPVPVLVLNEHGAAHPIPDATHTLRILVPLDGSALSEAALLPAAQLIAALATPFCGEVHLLGVVDLPSVYGKLKSAAHITDIAQEEARQEAEKYVKSMLEACEAAFAGTNLQVTSKVAFSTDVAGTIIKEAEQAWDGESARGCDMIAMATHGKEALSRLFMGSVTEHVLKTAKLPLLIVRPLQGEADSESEEPGDTTLAEVTGVREPKWPNYLRSYRSETGSSVQHRCKERRFSMEAAALVALRRSPTKAECASTLATLYKLALTPRERVPLIRTLYARGFKQSEIIKALRQLETEEGPGHEGARRKCEKVESTVVRW